MLCSAQAMLTLDVVIVAVAMPSIQDDLGISSSDLAWIVTAYSLAFGGFMVSAGRAADLFGAKRILLAGVLIFTVASVVCGLAPAPAWLFGARAVQGVGAALLSPAALALVTTSFPEGSPRNRALGIWGAASTAGGIAGYLVGGVLTDLLSWRAIFLINLPVGLAVWASCARIIRPDSVVTEGHSDFLGASLLTSGAVLVVAAVSGAAGGITPRVAFMALGGGALLAIFAAVESKAAEPLIRLGLFENPFVRCGNLVAIVSSAAALAATFFSTLYMQNVLGLSPLLTGVGFVPVMLVIVSVTSQTGALVEKLGIKRLLFMSSVLMALGLLLLSFVRVAGSYWLDVFPGLLVSGAGAGLSYGPAMITATTGVDDAEQGLASGLLNTAMQLGGALGLAALNTVTVLVADSGLFDGFSLQGALVDGYQAGFSWGLIGPALMLLAALALPEQRAAERSFQADRLSNEDS